MRIVPVVGVFAAALIMQTAGCGRNGATWTDIREVKPPVSATFRPIKSASPAKPLSVGQASDNKKQSISRAKTSVEYEIMQRIADNRTHWSDYQSGLCTQPRIFEPDTKPIKAAKVSAEPIPKPETQISPAVRCKYRDQFVNLQLKIAILEPRVAMGSEADTRELAAKLADAKEQLRSLTAACITETEALTAADKKTEENSPPK